jgi:hypothetical protein
MKTTIEKMGYEFEAAMQTLSLSSPRQTTKGATAV